MRLWHVDLLPVLPKLQLIGQLRECVAISSKIHRFGNYNQIIINRMYDYPIEHFIVYCKSVIAEIERRGYKVSAVTKRKLCEYIGDLNDDNLPVSIFTKWHNKRYLRQCLFNLQEKYDCGGISQDEWEIIAYIYKEELK